MGFNKILDRIEDKLEKYEENMDGEAPPWYGEKGAEDDSDDDGTTSTRTESGNETFELVEQDNEVQILVELPGVPEDSIDIKANEEKMRIEVEGSRTVDDRTYEYEFSEEDDPSTVEATYENGLLEVDFERN